VQSAVAEREAQLLKNPSWQDFATTECCEGTHLEAMVDALPPEGEIAVVPAFFTHKGMIVDLPGVLVIGVRAESGGAEARARTELLAKQLKTISDPTRLAILDALARNEMTVTEIATSFSLAQPTVSNHMKLLRDAGVVTSGGQARNRRLALQREVVEEMLHNLREVLVGAQS
jgi:DNA-binding transcriptional ArsR family regulator